MKTIIGIACTLLVSLGGCSKAGPGAEPGSPPGSSTAAKWCQATLGSTAEQLIEVMGAPASRTPTSMAWTDPPLSFYAFLDADGTAKQLDINVHALTPGQQAALPCPVVRKRRSAAEPHL